MNLTGIPHYELNGTIYFTKARHRDMAAGVPTPTWRFEPYVSGRALPGKGRMELKLHWNGSLCIYARRLKRRKDVVVDGRDFNDSAKADRCVLCDREFLNA